MMDNMRVPCARVFWRSIVCVLIFRGALAAPAAAQVATRLESFRVFLTDGRVFASHGECAALEDELVCVVKLGGQGVPESHDLVTVPLGKVDQERTAEYARALRAAHYGATWGAREYADLTADVSRALAELEASDDRDRRLGIAQVARARLVTWAGDHFGYKADELRQLVTLFDEVISELRAAAGLSQFSLDLVANLAPVSEIPLLPAFTGVESITAALAAASVTEVAAERLALLRSAARVASATADAPAALRAEVTGALRTEEHINAKYRALMTNAITRAAVAVRYGRPGVVQRFVREVEAADVALGSRRPREMAAFLRRLRTEVTLAQEQQAAYARWNLVKNQLFAYERRVGPVFDGWVSQRVVLKALHDQEIPRPAALDAALRRFASLEATLATLAAMPPPAELHDVHALLRTAVQMARQGLVLGRRVQVAMNDDIARNGSAAVAGAELLLARGRQGLVVALHPRKVR